MIRLALGAAALFILAIPIRGSSSEQRPAAEGFRGWFETAVLDRSPTVVLGVIAGSRPLPNGASFTTFDVEKTLRGTVTGQILVQGSDSSVGNYPKLKKFLFLKSSPNGTMFELVDAVDIEPSDLTERLDFLEKYLRFADDRSARPTAPVHLRDLGLRHIADPSTWVRRIALREVERLSLLQVATFRLADAGFLRDAPTAGFTDPEKLTLSGSASRIEDRFGLAFVREPGRFADDAARAAFRRAAVAFTVSTDTAARTAFLDDVAERFGPHASGLFAYASLDADALVAQAAIKRLGDVEAHTALAPLHRLALAVETRSELRHEAVVALGKIADPESVEVLTAVVRRDLERHEALRALALINNGEAALFLKDLEENEAKRPDARKDLLLLLAEFKTPEFRRTAARERAERRKRFGGS